MNFQQEVLHTVNTIFIYIEQSQNERIKTLLNGYQEQIIKKMFELDEQEDDIKIKEIYLQKLKKLLYFAQNSANLRQVWKLFSSQIYQQQDQFIELLKQFPNLIQFYLNQKFITVSTLLGECCTEFFSHQLITFQIQLQLDYTKYKDNFEKEDCVGCITYVSPEVENSKLFKIVMKLKGFTDKVKQLNELIKNVNLDSDLLKFTFQNKNQTVTFWSYDDEISYQVTTKLTLEDQPIFEQRIYLQTNMIIQLTKNFHLIINGFGNGNKQKQDYNQHFTPLMIKKEECQIKPIFKTDNQQWISINNGFENVIYQTNEFQQKLSQYQTLPKGLEVILQNDGFGYYITVIGDCSTYYPRIKSKRSKDQLLQLITCQDNFNLGIIYQENIRILLNSNLIPIWNGTEIFDL
ncbi:unnamed protein product [Paramecium primaurelia]|uniref:Uncharacterized protein n=1 Tax=Paramecium primaurelia TaxID=5886 RepID=A0A8S1PDM6_PARPR|nr:unnamed protein product [Paramecium primaurelia]